MRQERSILAGGCFWGMQDLVRRLDGVIATRVGYSGGDVANATYRRHGTHAEAIEVVFDADRLSFRNLLEFFFQVHDPTTRNRQGNDIGTQYRSGIFYHSPEQQQIAQEVIAAVTRERVYPNPIVTEVVPATRWYEAEAYHQEYFARNPFEGYCAYVVGPKVAKFRQHYASLLKA